MSENTVDTLLSSAEPVEQDYLAKLEPEYQEKARELALQIDEKQAQSVMTYGTDAQAKLAEFSESLLNHVQNKDTDEVGQILSNLMYQLKETDANDFAMKEPSFFDKLFGKVKRSIFEVTTKYQKVGAQVDGISARLEAEKNSLIADNDVLEKLYDKNKEFFTALNVYIAAGQLKLKELNQTTIPALRQKAQETQEQLDLQAVADVEQFADRLDKRTHDLALTRQMVIQQAPQIRLIQNANQVLSEKIQSSLHTAIPLWKNQIAITLTLLHQRNALDAQKQVTQTTNDLLRANSEMLKSSGIEVAKESERGVIDLETLKATQQNLIETLEETMRIQQTGFEKRREAEKELQVMEDELKQTLLAMKK